MNLELFKSTFNQLNADNTQLIENIYSKDIFFQDPFHHVEGIVALRDYFQELYKNVERVHFDFGEAVLVNQSCIIPWDMHLIHPRLNKGRNVLVEGVSWLEISDQGLIQYHRDYFDGGQMLYENISGLGSIIRWIKSKL